MTVTSFKAICTEDIRRTCAHLAETEVIRYTRPDRRTTAWATIIVVEETIMPPGDGSQLTVHAITEDGNRVCDEYTEGIDEYPQEIAAIIPEISQAARTQQATPAGNTPDDE